MILFLAAANKEQLGFDPTVHLFESKEVSCSVEPQFAYPSFVYQLGGRRYRTIGAPIYSAPTDQLCSHATRVWSVKEVGEDDSWLPGTEEHVLKDFWADEDHPKEFECQQAIKHTLQVLDLDGGNRAQEMDAYFLNIRHEEDIIINGHMDTTLAIPDLAIRQNFTWANSNLYGDHYWADYPCQSHRHRAPSSSPGLKIRLHRRLLFEEKCIRLTECANIAQVLNCIKQFSVGQSVDSTCRDL